MTYNIYPAVDENNNFPPEVREALVESPEFTAINWGPQRNVPSTADLNIFDEPGLWRITTPDTASIANLPPGMKQAGIFENLKPRTGLSTSSWWIQRISLHGDNPRVVWRSTRDTSGTWNNWEEILTNGGTPITDLRIILAVGQSNMSGRGLPSGGALDYQNQRIFQYGAKRRKIELASVPLDMVDNASGLSPATVMARTWLQSQPFNVAALIVPAAYGGTGFTTSKTARTWTPNSATDPLLDLPAMAVQQVKDAIDAGRAAGYSVNLEVIIWHQGENNSTMTQTAYSDNVYNLVQYFRSEFNNWKVPFVIGQMSPEGIEANAGRENIDAAHKDLPNRISYSAFAPAMRSGYNAGDTTHLSRRGVEYLGRNYADALAVARANADIRPRLKEVEDGMDNIPSIVADTLADNPDVIQSAVTMASSNAGLIAQWKPNTSYVVDQQAVHPVTGDILTRTANGTSGATFTMTGWRASATATSLASKMDDGEAVTFEQLPDLSGKFAALDSGQKILYSQLPAAAKAVDDKKPIGEGAFGLWAHDYGCKGDYKSTSNKGTDNATALNAFRDAAKAAATFGAVCLNFGPGAFRTTQEWDIYRSNSPRLDFVIKGESNLTTFILADFYGTSKRLIKSHDPLGVTRSSPTTIAHIQLGTVDRSGPNPVLLDIYGHGESRIESVRFGPCNNTVMTIAALQNVRYRDIVSFYGGKHYSYRDTTGITFTSTSGSTTVTASADVFNGSDAGRLLNLFGTTATKYLISTYVDARTVTISGTTPAITQNAVPGQFEPARITTVAGSNQVSANASVFTSDDIGRIIYILGARTGPWGAALLRATITGLVSGLTVTLDVPADISVTRTEFSVPVIEFYSPTKVGQLGTINGGSNDFKVDLLHIENYKGMGLIAQDTVFGRITDMKIHGEVTPTNTQSSAGAMWLDDYAGHISGDLDGHALGDHRIHYCNMNDTLTFGDLNTRRGVNARIHQVGVMTDPGGYVVIKNFNSYSATTSGDPYDMVEDTNTTPRLIHDGFVNMLGDALEPRIYTGRWSYMTMSGDRVMYSPNKTRYKIVVSDAGALSTTAATG